MKANEYTAKFLEVLDALDKNGNHIPGFIASHPGFGKTSTVQLWCKYKDYNLFTLIPSQYSYDDIAGLQTVQDGRLVKLTPSWFNKVVELSKNDKRTVIFIDEIGATDTYIQASLLNVIFNHEIEDKKLPDNILIIAAGNYSEDLNNAFKMSSPLVNRFMILNLQNSDYNINDVIGYDFDNLKDNKAIGKYLGIDKISGDLYSVEKFKEWIKNTNEITFNKAEITEDSKYGMMGFTSVRSLNYSLKFMEAYTSTFNDNLWMRIVGDTLGKSEKREGKLLRTVLENNSESFRSGKTAKKARTILEVVEDFNRLKSSEDIPSDLYKELDDIVEHLSLTTTTTKDIALLTGLFNCRPHDRSLQYINSKLSERLKSF